MTIAHSPCTRLLLLVLIVWLMSSHQALAGSTFHQVRHVIDGDTLILSDGRHLRLLGINTPEVARKSRPAEPGGVAAKHWLQQHLTGKRITLEGDRQGQDRYGRGLYYVFDQQHQLINERLLEQGLAVLSVHPPNVKYVRRLMAAEQRAQRKGVGIWGMREYRPLSIERALQQKRSGWQRLLARPVALTADNRFFRLIINERLDVRIPRANRAYFPDLQGYLNQPVEVRGWLSRRAGHGSVLVRHPSALVVIK